MTAAVDPKPDPLPPIRSLLAAVDFSADADRAARRAAQLARQHQARLDLLHVVEVDALEALREWLLPGHDPRAQLADEARGEMTALCARLGLPDGTPPRGEVAVGRPLDLIAAQGAHADVLVLGARGTHPLRELAVGTTADRLLRLAGQPMLVVRAEPAAPYQKVLALVDFSPSSLAALEAAQRLAAGAQVRLLHGYEVPFEGKLRLAGVDEGEILGWRVQARRHALLELERLAAGLRGTTSAGHTVLDGDVRALFPQALAQWQPDLVVIGKQGRSALQDLFLGSVTRAVLAESPCDVLVVPKGAQAR